MDPFDPPVFRHMELSTLAPPPVPATLEDAFVRLHGMQPNSRQRRVFAELFDAVTGVASEVVRVGGLRQWGASSVAEALSFWARARAWDVLHVVPHAREAVEANCRLEGQVEVASFSPSVFNTVTAPELVVIDDYQRMPDHEWGEAFGALKVLARDAHVVVFGNDDIALQPTVGGLWLAGDNTGAEEVIAHGNTAADAMANLYAKKAEQEHADAR